MKICTLIGTVNLLIILSEAAPTHDVEPLSDQGKTSITNNHDIPQATSVVQKSPVEASPQPNAPESVILSRVSKVSPSELETQETGYLPSAYPSATESDYGYDSGKNTYGKQASDWSLYDQGNHGLYDKYGDKAWKDQGHSDQASHGKHDSYGNSYNSHGSGHGSGYYSRDRGYGYEKHYAYDKEVASKHHADNHNNYGSQHGLHDHYGNSASNSHAHQGHDKYGQASRYGNHGYGKRGSQLAANHDYGHNQNKGHYYSHSSPQSYQHSYSSHVPTYRSTYSDYGPQIGYPSSYPSYY